MRKLRKVFNTLKGLFAMADRLKSKLSPIIKFLNTKITLFKGGALCTPRFRVKLPYVSYGRRRRWTGIRAGFRWKNMPRFCVIPQIGPFTPGQILRKLGSLISKAMKFVMKPFNPLLNPVKKLIDNMKRKIMGKLTKMFNRAFNLDKLMILPGIKNKVKKVFKSTKKKIKKDIMDKITKTLKKLPNSNGISHAANSKCFKNIKSTIKSTRRKPARNKSTRRRRSRRSWRRRSWRRSRRRRRL